MFTDEEVFAVGDGLNPANDVPEVRRQIDVWNVKAKPYRRTGSPTIYWATDVGGIHFGPFTAVESLFASVEERLRGTVKAGYKFGATAD